jgi:hypothetical protein
MSTDADVPDRVEAGRWEWLRELLEVVKSWGVRLGFYVLGGLLFAYYLKLIKDPLWSIGLATALAVLCAHLLLDIRQATERLNVALQARTETLFDLNAAAGYLANDLRGLNPGETVKIDHLGLDMYNAWPRVLDWLRHPVRVGVEVRFLMLTGASDRLPGRVPAEVAHWCQNVDESLRVIRQWLHLEGPALLKSGRPIRIRVKQYAEVPVLHGFAVAEPFRVTFVSLCRWEGATWDIYSWGERTYHRVSEIARDRHERDLADVFRARFEHLWNTSGDPVIDWPPQAGRVATNPLEASGAGEDFDARARS